ncbi:MAG: chromate transporter [Treponema sp.]|nr:chromate transporter [Treponema sp.]
MLKNLLDLYITFFKIGAVTFGGGYAMLPVLDRELAQKKKWVSGDDLLDYYAVSQVTPGVIAVNVSTFVGSKKAGIAGGIAATAGVVSPSIIIITVIALFISSFEKIVWVQKALAGVNVAVTALLSYAGFNFAKKAVKNWWGLLIYACSFCAVFFYKIPSVAVVLLALAVGLLIHFVCVGGVAKDAGGSAKKAGGVAEEAGGVAKDTGGVADDSGGSAKDADGSAKEACGVAKDPGSVAEEAGGFAEGVGGSAKDAGGSAKKAGGSSEEAVAFANRAIGLQEDAIAPTPAASAKVPADLPQKNKSKN